jgi:hypothetical protein
MAGALPRYGTWVTVSPGDRLLADQRHRREIGRRVVERVLVERLILRVGAVGAEHELIAVGRGFHDPVGPRHAAGAADILDDHLLPQDFGQPRRQNPAHGVGPAAGRERNHHGHRPARPALRRSVTGDGEQSERGCGENGDAASAVEHVRLPV